jgi:hypothetical protein
MKLRRRRNSTRRRVMTVTRCIFEAMRRHSDPIDANRWLSLRERWDTSP